MEIQTVLPKKKYGVLSYITIIVGILCFLFVFVPQTRIANIGNAAGDYITMLLTGAGIVLSIIGLMKKTEKKAILILSLLLSLSLILFWIITILLLFTGQIEFAP